MSGVLLGNRKKMGALAMRNDKFIWYIFLEKGGRNSILIERDSSLSNIYEKSIDILYEFQLFYIWSSIMLKLQEVQLLNWYKCIYDNVFRDNRIMLNTQQFMEVNIVNGRVVF